MPWIDWRSISIVQTESHFSSNETTVRDRIRVTLEMPTETYRKFRQQIEVPETLRNRRAEDPSQGK